MEANKDTGALILRMAMTVRSEMQISDIDHSHRVGNPRQPQVRHRDIIVKFSTYRSHHFFLAPSTLKDSGYRGLPWSTAVCATRCYRRKCSSLLRVYEGRRLIKLYYVQTD